MANRISAPIRRLTQATKSVAVGDLGLEIETNARGEIKDLVSGFNYMLKELKRNQTILAEIEREEAWKEMAKQVAHEVKNPLTPMKLSIQQLITAYRDKSDKFDTYFNKITSALLNQIEILRNIATEFSSFARMPRLKMEEIDFIPAIQQTIDLFNNENVKISFAASINEAVMLGDFDQFKRMMVNIVRNSIQANANEIKFNLFSDEVNYIISISDNGHGIPHKYLENVFSPSFTTKPDGMGIGLSIAKRFFESIHGSIDIAETNENGTTIRIKIPKL
jgi:nitrogen fixation/metabolism regulation signal transduction histidine kinase